MQTFLTNTILYFAIPLWLLAGLCDWFSHRITAIEKTSGLRESVLHAVMLAEVGIPLLVALLFEVNALIFAIAILAWLAHEATAFWDVSYAQSRRYLSPFEQHVHSFLELLPLLVLALAAAIHWPQFLALFGSGPAAADFSLRWKHDPLSPIYLASLFTAILLLQILPFAEEIVRCYRGRREIALPPTESIPLKGSATLPGAAPAKSPRSPLRQAWPPSDKTR